MESQKVRIESDSEPGNFYEVDTKAFTCTCPYQNRKLRMLPIDDPHRLCKHLIKVLADKGVPDIFKKYAEDIKWFSQHNASFTSRERALIRQEQQAFQEARHQLFTPDQIVVLSREKKRKYLYIEAKAIERAISASIKLDNGDTTLTLNKTYGFYSYVQNTCSFPDPYRFMAPAIILWLDIEYSELTGQKRAKSDENIRALYTQMTNSRQEVPIGAITTLSREGGPSQPITLEWGEWTEEEFNCVFVRAHVDSKNNDAIQEPTEIEAIIPVSGRFLLFRINHSSPVKLFIKEVGSKIILSTSYAREESVSATDGWGVKMGISETTEDDFPKKFSYIEEALFVWLEEEIHKAGLNLDTD